MNATDLVRKLCKVQDSLAVQVNILKLLRQALEAKYSKPDPEVWASFDIVLQSALEEVAGCGLDLQDYTEALKKDAKAAPERPVLS